MDEQAAETGAATGGVNILLRLEGLTLFVGMMVSSSPSSLARKVEMRPCFGFGRPGTSAQ